MERLIDFNDAATAAEGRQVAVAHGLADTMGEKPRGFVGGLKRAVQLVGRNALLAAGHQIDRL